MVFSHSVARFKANYNDIGKLDFSAREIVGKEYAQVDDANTGRDKNFVFYAGNESNEIATKLNIVITMQATHGGSIANFKAGCYAKDVNVSANFTSSGEHYLTPHLVADSNITVSYEIYMDDDFMDARRSAFGLANLPESADEICWFKIDAGFKNLRLISRLILRLVVDEEIRVKQWTVPSLDENSIS